jgi:hypothetical protein
VGKYEDTGNDDADGDKIKDLLANGPLGYNHVK